MTKMKKQRNHVLIRRVKRTSAAILLVMAVAVAAIPVENLGTVQAEVDEDFDMATIYDAESGLEGDYDSNYFYQNYEGAYRDSNDSHEFSKVKTVQQAAGSSAVSVEDVYEIALNSSADKAIVSGYGTITDIEVSSKEYYGLVMFRVSDSQNTLNLNDISVTFEDASGTNSVDISTNAYYMDSNGRLQKLTAFAFGTGESLKKLNADSYAGKESSDVTLQDTIQVVDGSEGVTDDSNGYDKLIESDKTVSQKTLVDNAEKSALESWQTSEIATYNDEISKLVSIASKVNGATVTTVDGATESSVTLTSDEVDLWNDYVSSWSNKHDTAATLTISSDKFADDDGNGLADVYDYIICNYYGYNTANNLNAYSLTRASYVTDKGNETVYLAKINDDGILSSLQYLYDDTYLVTGQATIVGVASEAFEGELIKSISLPSTITFIGAEAFKGCTALTTVSINTTNCKIIGNSAFENTALNSLTFSSGSALTTIGSYAFRNTKLTKVTIPSSVTDLGNCSFMDNYNLKSVEFDSTPVYNVTVGKYAFYNCYSLTEVDFPSIGKQYYIMKGAFAVAKQYTDASLDFAFPSGNSYIDYSSIDGDSNTSTSTDDYDYILAGRRNLSSVYFALTSGTIPDNTLRGCYNLAYAEFDTNNTKTVTYTSDKLFADVTNESFYVYGPKLTNNGSVAGPRKSSWTGIVGYKMSDGVTYAPVPYMYEDSEGTHIELGYNGGEYVATINIISDSEKTAELESYTVNSDVATSSNTRISITIPDEVGGYKIVSIGEDCFDNDVKNRLYELIISDGYITEIADEAFKSCPYLERVYIGYQVESIGDEAFANCPMLENVEFSQTVTGSLTDDDDSNWTTLTIGEDAFNTQSEHLTFHGAINENYAPYALAMSADGASMTKSNANICYKTDAPLNLTVLRNNSTGEATLVDYPHYDEIDKVNEDYIEDEYGEGSSYSITEEFEAFYIDENSNNSDYPADELAMVKAALYLDLPSGIDSVDSKSLFGTNDEDDEFYVQKVYSYSESNAAATSSFKDNPVYVSDYLATDIRNSSANVISKLYSKDGSETGGISDVVYKNAYGDSDVSIGGLFSGYFNEDGDNNNNSGSSTGSASKGFLDDKSTYGGHTYVAETYESGNDYLTSVDMPTVESLPDYAFDSCENLLTAAFTDAMQSIGVLPFRDCKSMYDIDFGTDMSDGGSTNGYYAFKNMILYENNGDDTNTDYEIMEVLEGRGAGGDYLTSTISADEILDNVSSIADGAFSNNDYLTSVDLSSTTIREVPDDCFKNDPELYSITLPSTVRTIGSGALVTGSKAINITIPTGNCTISTDAMDGKTIVNISGVAYDEDGELTNLYYSYLDLVKSYGEEYVNFYDVGTSYTIAFFDRDLKVIDSFTVDIKNGETYDLSKNEISDAPEIDGYDFEYWMCNVNDTVYTGVAVGDEAFTGIAESRNYYPYYVANPSSVTSDGNLYTLRFENCIAMNESGLITSGTQLYGGDTITFMADDENTFSYWSVEATSSTDTNDYTSNFTSVSKYVTTFTMPNASVKVTANDSTVSGSSTDSSATYTLTVNYGSGSGEYAAGETVTISAYAPTTSGYEFSKWTSATSNVGFADATSSITTIVMPTSDVTVTANYAESTSSSGSSSSSDDDDDDEDTYTLTVNYGSGSGEYEAGERVTIAAYAPESSTKVFSKWTTTNSDVGFASATAATTTLVMPSEDVTVTANYKTRTSDDDDDDDDDSSSSSSGRTSVASTTTATNGTNGSGTSTTTTSTSTTTSTDSGSSDDGNKIYITKNGISNKDVASITVEGSTDNFIVRISESDEATEAAKLALTNEYGSLDNLVYFPMDISLYDATGQNKITDSYGLNITVTMPIPDVLIQYGGNARVAACDDGVLTQITPKFTTIDGIACISFTPPHFSPYVIYVDTSNLTAGTLDSTPKTGDPIHPKWFLAIGLGCASVVLFATSDGRRRRKFRTV